MTLLALAQRLREQATATGSIILNADILAQDYLDKLRTAFLLEMDQFLTIKNIVTNDIPDPRDGKLQLSAGSVSVLKQVNLVPTIVFTVDDKDALQFVIGVALGENWSFKDSFPQLDIFPFNKMTISRAYFACSSQAMSGYAPWPDKPQDLVDLQPGLNFAAPMSLDIFSSAVTMLEELVDSHTPLKFSGSFSPDGSNAYPIAKLTFTAGSKSFHLTDQLSVGNPAFVIEITEPVDLLQDISLTLTASTDDLDFSTEISGGDPTLTFSAVPKPGRQFTADKILTLPGGEHFREFIPDELIHAFAECTLKDFSITLAAGKGISLLSLSVASAEGFKWSLVPDALILEDLALELNVLDPSGPDGFTLVSLSAMAQIFPSIFPDKFDFHLGLDQAAAGNKWEVSSITGSYFRNVNLHDLVAAIAGQASGVPDELHAINFSDFDVEVTKQGDSHSYSLRTRCDAAFPILDTSVSSSLFLVADYSGAGHEIDLRGFIEIGDEDFSLELKLSDSASAGIGASPLHLSWAANGTSSLQLEDIAEALGFKGGDIPNLPPGFSLSLKSADLTYDYVTKELEVETDGTLTIAGMQVPFKAARKGGLWTLEGKADSNQQIDFITLITELFREFGFDLPDHLPEFSLKNLQVDYNFATKDLTFAGDSSVPSPVQFGNATHQINSSLDLKIRTDATGKRTYAGYLRGTVAFGGAVFQGEFDFGAATVLKGYWDGSAGSLNFADLANSHGIDHSLQPPGGLPLELTRAAFEYDVPKGRFLLSADSKYGEAFFITSNANSQWDFAFGILIEPSDIPGFPSLGALSVQDTMLVLSTVQDDSFVVPTLPGVRAPGVLAASAPRTFPTIGTTKMHLQPGVSLAAVLQLGNGGSNAVMKTLHSAVGQSELLIEASVADMSSISFMAYLDGSLTMMGSGANKLVLSNAFVELTEGTSGFAVQISGGVMVPFNHVTLQVICALAISDVSMQALLQLKAEEDGHPTALPVTFGLPGAPLDELDIEVGVDFEPPGVDLGVEGKFHIAGQEADANDFIIVLDLEGEVPNPEYLSTHIQSLTIADAITACTGIVESDAPSVMTAIQASEISMYWSESAGIVLPDGTLSQAGFGFNGLLTVAGFSMHAGLTVSSSTGVSGDAEMSPIHLGSVFSLTGSGQGVKVKQAQIAGQWETLGKPLDPTSKLPTREYQVIDPGGATVAFNSKKSPYLDVSAKASLFNFLNSDVEIEIRDDGFNWKQKESIGSIVTIEFDCAVNQSGFSTHAEFDLNLKGDVGPIEVLGIDFGTLHLDISLDAEMDIIINSAGFSLTVSGSFHFEGANLTMPALTITENFKSFEELPEAILKHIDDEAKEIFADIIDEANQIFGAAEKEAKAIGAAAEAEAEQIGADAREAAEKVVAGATAAYQAAKQDLAQAEVEAKAIEADAVKIAGDAATDVINIAADAGKIAGKLDDDAKTVLKAAEGVVKDIGKALDTEVTKLRDDAEAVWSAAKGTAIQIGKDADIAVAAIEQWGKQTGDAIAAEAVKILHQIKQEIDRIGDEITEKVKEAAEWLERQAKSVWHEVSKY